MDDQTKSIQTLSIQGSIEHGKHNPLDIKYLHHLFIRNPQLGCLANHYNKTQHNISLSCARYPFGAKGAENDGVKGRRMTSGCWRGDDGMPSISCSTLMTTSASLDTQWCFLFCRYKKSVVFF